MRESEQAEQRTAVARIGKHHVLRSLDPPIAAAADSDREDHGVGLMRCGGVGVAAGELRPKMQDCGIVIDSIDLGRIDAQRQTAIDRAVNRAVPRDDLINATPISRTGSRMSHSNGEVWRMPPCHGHLMPLRPQTTTPPVRAALL